MQITNIKDVKENIQFTNSIVNKGKYPYIKLVGSYVHVATILNNNPMNVETQKELELFLQDQISWLSQNSKSKGLTEYDKNNIINKFLILLDINLSLSSFKKALKIYDLLKL